MAHFAKVDSNNKVLTVLYIETNLIVDENGNESELLGQQYLEKHHAWPAELWKKTSYGTKHNKHYTVDSNGNNILSLDQSKVFRGNYAGIGYTYDSTIDQFKPPQVFKGWNYNVAEATWKPPTPQPDDNVAYNWNNETESWVKSEDFYS